MGIFGSPTWFRVQMRAEPDDTEEGLYTEVQTTLDNSGLNYKISDEYNLNTDSSSPWFWFKLRHHGGGDKFEADDIKMLFDKAILVEKLN